MRNLREAIRQKRLDLWKNKNWLLHHDNAPAHTSLLVRDLLANNNTLMMPQPPYSPDLAPCDFFLFPKLKRPMKGRRYATLDEIKTASKEELKKDFKKCFFEVLRRLEKPLAQVFWIVFDFYLLKKMDQRTCIKFCVKNEIKCSNAFRMLTVAYLEATLDRSNAYRWYKLFSEGQEDVNDEERAGRPSTSTTDEKINEVEKMILAIRRIIVREVAEDLNISIGSCPSIFINDLGMRLVAAKFVPKLLNCDQKQHRMNIANEMLPLCPRRPKFAPEGHNWGLVHHEFLPQGRTVNKEYYLQVMRNLREEIRQKCPDLWKNKNWLLHHDNAPAHTSLLVRDLLDKNNTLMMPQPPYSPEMAPCDFFLFPKLKRPMKGRCYATLDEIKTASKEELKKILKNDFLKCFEDWKNRWHKCIISHGDYFEENKIGIHE
ncbi:hypothetical protein LAZ67_3001635 [Cordylochernes scorpioides]|uniref:Transposase n=1 Tax=Cordylochernes scorpioides TaxID=51811 RepID=A0ABY6K730_9ARAC|nr:hypothetical protein LAZ67_3001635 [Cordylochernes scorpioides]